MHFVVISKVIVEIFNDETNTTLEETDFKSDEIKNIPDPGTWPKILSDSLRLQTVKTGPVKQNIYFKYPTDRLTRRFAISIFK